jgi:hypothetical protein
MAKRRKANRDEVMMIPFLDILCALIGVLILIIVVLCVAQTRQSNGRTPEEESLARKFAELTQMLKTAEQESAPLKTRLAELTATQAEARAREARLTELRKHLEMSGAEAKTNKEQATVLQKQVENQVSQIEAIIRQVTPMAKEIEALKKELELRKKKPDDKPLPVLVQPSGSGFGGNRNDRGGDRGQARAPFQAQPGQGFNDRNFADRAPRRPDDRGGFGGDRGGNFAPREERNFAARDDRNFGARNEGFAPRPDFAARKPAFAKPGFAKPGFAKPAGKVFVPRDAAKKAGKFVKPARD